MIILVNGKSLSVTVRESDMMNNQKRFYAFKTTGYTSAYYDPRANFKPCFQKAGDAKARKLNDKDIAEYNSLLNEADEVFDGVYAAYMNKVEQAAKAQQPELPQGGGLGNQLEAMMLKVLAEQSVDKVVEYAKPLLEKHVIETFGMVPQVIKVQSPKGEHEVQGVTHEKFNEVLNFVNAGIPVFLTGAAGTGKNVICKQVAEALGLEFYFSNAVTQEYKITGFIDANGKFHETQFYQAFVKGGLFMLDEMDASVPEVLTMLNAAIANHYFDFPTGRVEAHEDFRVVAAGNTFGTGADIEYTGRYQLDAATLNRFVQVGIDYSPKIEAAIANGDTELVDYIHGFRKAVNKAGIKHVASYRNMEYIAKMKDILELTEVLQSCLFKNLPLDDLRIIADTMKHEVGYGNRYYAATRQITA